LNEDKPILSAAEMKPDLGVPGEGVSKVSAWDDRTLRLSEMSIFGMVI